MNVCLKCQRQIPDGATYCAFCQPAAPVRPCPRCGRSVDATADYCGYCGQGLRPSLLVVCQNCAQLNRHEAAFCVYCGASMSRVETVERCSQCGREKSADLPFCPWCGAANHPQEQGVCPKCQAAISPADEFCQQCGAPLRVPKAAVFAAETPATPTTAPKQSSRLVWALVIAGLVFLIFLLVYLSSNSQPEPVATPTPLSSAITSKGVIQVGKPAYADGRSLGGGPLATRMYIPVWEDAPGTIVKCHVHHGGSVSVAAVRWVEAEQQYYFRIEAEGCEGWVVELLIGDSAQPAVGERL